MTFFDGFKKRVPEISQEASKFFTDLERLQKINPDIPIDFKGFIDGGNLADETLIKFLSTTDKSNISLENYKTHLESVGKTTTVAAKAMSGLKQVGSVLASMGTAAAVAGGISLALKALDDYTHQYTRALENASTAADEYAAQKSNVQALTSEYDTLQSKIRELQALQLNGGITMQQEVELANLQNQSAELERQLDIQKQLLDAKAHASADAAIF